MISARRWRSLSSKDEKRRPGPVGSMPRSVSVRIGVTVRFTPDSAVTELAVEVPLAMPEPVEDDPERDPAGRLFSPTSGPVAPVPWVIWDVVGVMLRSVSARCMTGPVSHLERYLFS